MIYQVTFLPIARQDMLEIVRYIRTDLCNPTAAYKLAEEMIDAANSLAELPYAHPVYQPIRPLQHEYRKILVKNFLMFYWTEEITKTVTIARVIYARRDFEKML